MKNTLKYTLHFGLFIIILSFPFTACQKTKLGDLNLNPLLGKATKEDIRALFGSPDSVAEAQGETLYLYVIKHQEKADRLEYNPASGRRELSSRVFSQWEEIVLMRFDKNGILRYWSVEKM